MVDITEKESTDREAWASCKVIMSTTTLARISEKTLDKGDALEVARIAGLMAAKKTAELIPLCHPIALTSVEVLFELGNDGVVVKAGVRTTDRTGVEMEALTAASIAALTIYDMVKSIERGVTIIDLSLTSKSGGRSGSYERPS